MENSYAFETLVYVYPADDVPGQWIAHAIENDVVTVGDDVEHAIHMGIEAAVCVAFEDYSLGIDPRERGKKTPSEVRERAYRLVEEGEPCAFKDLPSHKADIGACAFPFVLMMSKVVPAQEQQEERPAPKPKRAFVSTQAEAACP